MLKILILASILGFAMACSPKATQTTEKVVDVAVKACDDIPVVSDYAWICDLSDAALDQLLDALQQPATMPTASMDRNSKIMAIQALLQSRHK